MNDLLNQSWTWMISAGIKIPFIIAGALILIRVSFMLINRLKKLPDEAENQNVRLEMEKRANTLVAILKQMSVVGVSGIAFMMVLRELKMDITPIIAGAGVLSLAVGFGAQSIVKDVISGFFILLENQFDVGDAIEGAGVSGAVEKMNLRFTQLRDIEGRVHFIPNGEFRVVSNMTRGWSQALVDIGVAYKEDIDNVNAVLTGVADTLQTDPVYGLWMTHPMAILGVDSLGDSAVTIRVLFKTSPGKHWDLAREFRKRVKKRFEETGIEIPFPHRVVLMPGAQAPAAVRSDITEGG